MHLFVSYVQWINLNVCNQYSTYRNQCASKYFGRIFEIIGDVEYYLVNYFFDELDDGKLIYFGDYYHGTKPLVPPTLMLTLHDTTT